MTVNAPIQSRPASLPDRSLLRLIATRAFRWWHDLRTGGRRDEVPVLLRPFSFWEGQTSALSGEGGTDPSLVPMGAKAAGISFDELGLKVLAMATVAEPRKG